MPNDMADYEAMYGFPGEALEYHQGALRQVRADAWTILVRDLQRWLNLYGSCTVCEVTGERRELYCWNCAQPYNKRSESR